MIWEDVVVELNAVEWDVMVLAMLSLQPVVQLRRASSGTGQKALGDLTSLQLRLVRNSIPFHIPIIRALPKCPSRQSIASFSSISIL